MLNTLLVMKLLVYMIELILINAYTLQIFLKMQVYWEINQFLLLYLKVISLVLIVPLVNRS